MLTFPGCASGEQGSEGRRGHVLRMRLRHLLKIRKHRKSALATRILSSGAPSPTPAPRRAGRGCGFLGHAANKLRRRAIGLDERIPQIPPDSKE